MLTYEDIEILLAAVNVWESEPMNDAFSSGLLGAMMSTNKEEAQNSLKDGMEVAKETKKSRERQAILLKAKLITMQTVSDAQDVATELTDTGKNE